MSFIQNSKLKIYKLLRSSESFFKTDMVYLAKGGFWLTVGQGVASATSFLLAIAFANLLPKEVYGTYKYILALGGTLAVFTLTGIGTAVTQAVARGVEGVYIPAFKTRVKWSIFGSIVGLSGFIYYYLNGNLTLSFGLLIIAVLMPIMETLGLYDSLLHGRKRFDISTKYFAISQTVSVTLSLITLWFTTNVIALIFIYYFSWSLMRAIFFRKTLPTSDSHEEASSTISYGKHLSLMGVIGVVANYADRILVFHYVGALEAAIYAISIAIPEQLKGVFKNIGNLALPKFSESSVKNTDQLIWGKIVKFGIVLIAVTIIYILAAPLIFNLLFPQYLDSVYYSQIFSLSLIVSISVIPISLLQALERKKELYFYNTSTSLIQIALLFVGAFYYGLLGVILARIISRFISLIISIYLIRYIKVT